MFRKPAMLCFTAAMLVFAVKVNAALYKFVSLKTIVGPFGVSVEHFSIDPFGTVAIHGRRRGAGNGGVILWTESGLRQLTDPVDSYDGRPSVYGEFVAWLRFFGGADPYLMVFNGETIGNLGQIARRSPRVSEGYISYSGFAVDGIFKSIEQIEIATGSTRTIGVPGSRNKLGAFREQVAWVADGADHTSGELWYFDGQSQRLISTEVNVNSTPSVYDGHVVWDHGGDAHEGDIQLWDGTSTRVIYDHTVQPFGMAVSASIYDGLIVFTAFVSDASYSGTLLVSDLDTLSILDLAVGGSADFSNRRVVYYKREGLQLGEIALVLEAGVPTLRHIVGGVGAAFPAGAKDRFISPLSEQVGFDQFTATMTDDTDLESSNVVWTGPVESTPGIAAFLNDGDGRHTIRFDRPLAPGHWARIVLGVRGRQSGMTAEIECWVAHHPDDVDQDGHVTIRDATAFGTEVLGQRRLELVDTNGDGRVDLLDRAEFESQWTGERGSPRAWEGHTLPPRP